ncbi:transcription factor LHW-like [Vicia villosa]|uniref:transcription factor LHW-like n=1 Tax=Vicia villosa TaxID=3911 RepID=UPI00273AE98B|nr:transcription factor LHW-like [Vicia villosa]
MGFLLKEVLKTLCGRNQWSYAVFWKIGCNNSKLLIWEECYYEQFSRPSVPNPNEEGCWFSSEFQSSHLGIQEEDRVGSLINKLSVNNLVVVAGEGIIGRAAFTNSHEWILLNNFAKDAYPPEVYAEMHLQFSAGMQTVSVIPVLPHGVVQVGSFLPIMENIGFVHEVKSLILQLGCIPNALLSEDYSAKFSNERLDGRATSGVPVSVDLSVITSNSTRSVVNGSNHQSYSSHSLCPLRGENNSRQDRVVVAEVIPSNFDSSQHQHSVSYNAVSEFNNLAGSAPFGQSGPCDYVNPRVNVSSSVNISQLKTDRSHNINHNMSSSSTSLLRGIPVHGGMNSLLRTPECSEQKILPEVSKFSSTDQKIDYNMLQTRNIPCFNVEEHVPNSSLIPGFVRDCIEKDGTGQSAMNPKHEEACGQHSSGGDDLFDILGMDFKNELLKGHWNELFADEPDGNAENMVKKETCLNIEGTSSDYYSANKSMSDSGIFSGMSTDNLLDAVVSKAKPTMKQNSDDFSCRTTLTGNSTASIPSPLGRKFMSSNFQGGLFDIPKNGGKTGAVETSSLRSGCSKDENFSQTTTLCGSQLSSWLENGGNLKGENSVSTGYSKRPNEACKSNRKRLKPGENPRPRPKDRQMIQDRVKELREIVPNGGKCSIDALLERTIKHMLFLQSVTKHADKLKKTGESKIISKEGGLVLKDNFEGGATWAYEVGSQSMVCPIIVEDLNTPRQMLVEMLCEERGFFLEIADLIRGLGLTILKGVMEAHNDKIWARFVVEANRDVTRMEIFMSLVRLLEQTMKGNASSSNAIDDMLGYNSLPQKA